MGKDISISLVICTKNRAEQLRTCLQSVSEMACDYGWEIVVVNNGSSDHTDIVVKEFMASSSITTQLLHESTPGLGAARNSGWLSAKSNLVAFIDDDCYPTKDFLNSTIICFNEDASLGFVGGRVLLFDPNDQPITIQTSETRQEFEARSFIRAGLIHGANFTFRKRALEAIGGFDPRFGAGTPYPCEDVDALARTLGLGWRGAYDPRPSVYHHHRRKTIEEVRDLMRLYDRGRGAFYTKCMLNSTLRRPYLSAWIRAMRWQPLAVTTRELISAMRFICFQK